MLVCSTFVSPSDTALNIFVKSQTFVLSAQRKLPQNSRGHSSGHLTQSELLHSGFLCGVLTPDFFADTFCRCCYSFNFHFLKLVSG